ncbi:unnamed protein product [Triticum turgidum subsp. durum]|uniref:Uncharacterized protein n=1 Tax=Triticum turgidum subsp. durum TaxID=4567 RepID=A0A9R0Y7B9_TRITD|nr:unnamed protein product [Triticum turgidum subsp. durum]
MGRLADAMDNFSQMIGKGVQPNTVVYHSLIQGFSTHGDLRKAKELVYEMTNKGIPCPNIAFFSSVMDGICKEGRVMDAHDIFHLVTDIGLKPNIITFNTLIDGHCLVGEMEKAFGVLDSMVSAGIEADVFTYNTLAYGYCRCGRIDDGLILFREMLQNKPKPTTITYNIILDGLFRAGRTFAAKKMFVEMIETGITKLGAMNVKFDIKILNTMINAMFKVRRREEANGLFAAISASGMVPNTSTYSVMIGNLLKEGSVEEAENMFSLMEKSGCAPDSRLINNIIRILLENGDIVKAGNYMSKVDGKSISLEASTTSLLMCLFSSKGKYREQISLLPVNYQFFNGVG